jgi:hypothetical protein
LVYYALRLSRRVTGPQGHVAKGFRGGSPPLKGRGSLPPEPAKMAEKVVARAHFPTHSRYCP